MDDSSSPVKGMEYTMKNDVVCAMFENPPFDYHIPEPPKNVTMPEKGLFGHLSNEIRIFSEESMIQIHLIIWIGSQYRKHIGQTTYGLNSWIMGEVCYIVPKCGKCWNYLNCSNFIFVNYSLRCRLWNVSCWWSVQANYHTRDMTQLRMFMAKNALHGSCHASNLQVNSVSFLPGVNMRRTMPYRIDSSHCSRLHLSFRERVLPITCSLQPHKCKINDNKGNKFYQTRQPLLRYKTFSFLVEGKRLYGVHKKTTASAKDPCHEELTCCVVTPHVPSLL